MYSFPNALPKVLNSQKGEQIVNIAQFPEKAVKRLAQMPVLVILALFFLVGCSDTLDTSTAEKFAQSFENMVDGKPAEDRVELFSAISIVACGGRQANMGMVAISKKDFFTENQDKLAVLHGLDKDGIVETARESVRKYLEGEGKNDREAALARLETLTQKKKASDAFISENIILQKLELFIKEKGQDELVLATSLSQMRSAPFAFLRSTLQNRGEPLSSCTIQYWMSISSEIVMQKLETYTFTSTKESSGEFFVQSVWPLELVRPFLERGAALEAQIVSADFTMSDGLPLFTPEDIEEYRELERALKWFDDYEAYSR